MLPAVTAMEPFWVVVTVPCVTATLMPASAWGVPSVTAPDPATIFGDSVTVPLAGTMMASGFKSHSAAGNCVADPVTTSRVAE